MSVRRRSFNWSLFIVILSKTPYWWSLRFAYFMALMLLLRAEKQNELKNIWFISSMAVLQMIMENRISGLLYYWKQQLYRKQGLKSAGSGVSLLTHHTTCSPVSSCLSWTSPPPTRGPSSALAHSLGLVPLLHPPHPLFLLCGTAGHRWAQVLLLSRVLCYSPCQAAVVLRRPRPERSPRRWRWWP